MIVNSHSSPQRPSLTIVLLPSEVTQRNSQWFPSLLSSLSLHRSKPDSAKSGPPTIWGRAISTGTIKKVAEHTLTPPWCLALRTSQSQKFLAPGNFPIIRSGLEKIWSQNSLGFGIVQILGLVTLCLHHRQSFGEWRRRAQTQWTWADSARSARFPCWTRGTSASPPRKTWRRAQILTLSFNRWSWQRSRTIIQIQSMLSFQVQKKWSGGSLKSPDRDLELDQLYKVWAPTYYYQLHSYSNLWALITSLWYHMHAFSEATFCSSGEFSKVTFFQGDFFPRWLFSKVTFVVQVSAQSGSSSVRSLTSRSTSWSHIEKLLR